MKERVFSSHQRLMPLRDPKEIYSWACKPSNRGSVESVRRILPTATKRLIQLHRVSIISMPYASRSVWMNSSSMTLITYQLVPSVDKPSMKWSYTAKSARQGVETCSWRINTVYAKLTLSSAFDAPTRSDGKSKRGGRSSVAEWGSICIAIALEIFDIFTINYRWANIT